MSKTITPLMDARLTAEGAERGRLKAVAERDALAQRCAELERDLATAHADASHYASRAEELRAEADRYRAAWDLWHEKTEWVQQAITEGALPPRYLGMHRADILRAEVTRRGCALLDGGEA